MRKYRYVKIKAQYRFIIGLGIFFLMLQILSKAKKKFMESNFIVD